MKSNRIFKIAVIIIIIVFVGYVLFQSRQNSGTVKIGGVFALTGAGASMGLEELRGAELAVEEININGGIKGKRIEFIGEDLSIDKLKNAGLVANKLISVDKVKAIVGAQWDEPTEAILPAIEAARIPMIGHNTTDNVEAQKSYEYLFGTWYDSRVGIDVVLDFAKKKNLKNIALMRVFDGGFWKFTHDIFVERAPSYGVNIVEDIDLGNPLVTDFRTHLLKIKQSKPDALFMVVGDINECALLQQMKDMGLMIPLLATEAAGNDVSLSQCPKQLENVYFSAPVRSSRFIEFNEKFKQKYGMDVLFPSTITAYDAVGIITDALEKTNLAGNDILRDAIAKTNNYQGVSLTSITFKQNGFVDTPPDSFEMQTVKDSKIIKYENNQ